MLIYNFVDKDLFSTKLVRLGIPETSLAIGAIFAENGIVCNQRTAESKKSMEMVDVTIEKTCKQKSVAY